MRTFRKYLSVLLSDMHFYLLQNDYSLKDIFKSEKSVFYYERFFSFFIDALR
jgi:hypothetical protein